MKTVICILLLLFLAGRLLAEETAMVWEDEKADTSIGWKLHDKILVGAYLIGETIDVLQTKEGLRHPDKYSENNPFIKNETDLYISAILSTTIILWSANHFKEHRTTILVGCNTIKWGFVINNHSVGVRINLGF